MNPRRAAPVLLLAVILAAVQACSTDPLAPFQPEVSNMPGTFQLQATGLQDVTATEEYVWSNQAQTANVNQSTTLTAGSAVLTLIDNTAASVYLHDLEENGTFQASTGQEGSWTIRLELMNYSGDLNFRVETP